MPSATEMNFEYDIVKLKLFVQVVIEKAIQQYLEETGGKREHLSDDHQPCNDVIQKAIQQYIEETEADSRRLLCTGRYPYTDYRPDSKDTDNEFNDDETDKEEPFNHDTNDSCDKLSPNHEVKPLLKDSPSVEEMQQELGIRDRCIRLLEYLACCNCTCFKRSYHIASDND